MPPTALSATDLSAHALAKAAPSCKVFDPWNNVSTGHQRAENRLGSSSGWRESRTAKLQNQFTGGLANDGGEVTYDLVGAGARDEGIEWIMRREGIARSKNGERWGDVDNWLRTDNEAQKAGPNIMSATNRLMKTSSGVMRRRETEWLRGADKEKARANPNFAEKYPARWNGTVREEAICRIAGKKRVRDWASHEEQVEYSRLGPAYLVVSAEDSDEVWDPVLREEEETAGLDVNEDMPTTFHVEGKSLMFGNEHESTTRVSLDMQLALDDDEIWDTEPSNKTDIRTDHDREESFSVKEGNSVSYFQDNETNAYHQQQDSKEYAPNGQDTGSKSVADSKISFPAAQHSLQPAGQRIEPSSLPSLLTTTPKPVFKGLSVYISGSTMPQISDHALRQLLVFHGADICLDIKKCKVTHVLMGRPNSADTDSEDYDFGGPLAASKMQREISRVRTSGGKGIRYVSAEWVLESVRNAKRLSETRFAVGAAEAGLRDQRAENENGAAATGARIQTGTQYPHLGPLTEEEREAIGAAVHEWERAGPYKSGYRSRSREGSGSGNRQWKSKAAASATMPGVPAGQRSVRNMFIRQGRDQAWKRAGFEKTG